MHVTSFFFFFLWFRYNNVPVTINDFEISFTPPRLIRKEFLVSMLGSLSEKIEIIEHAISESSFKNIQKILRRYETTGTVTLSFLPSPFLSNV
jgi:hypothetical protein